MNCNEEFTIKLIGKLTLELNHTWEEQKRVRDCIYNTLYEYDVVSRETGLIKGDIHEKITLYLQVKKLEGYSSETLKNYGYNLRRFADFINKPVATVTKNDLRYYLMIATKDKKPSTANSLNYYLKSFFNWLEAEEMIPKSPARSLSVNKLPKRLRKSLTVAELEKLRIACINDRERAVIEFLFATGCRLSEVLALNVEDLNFSDNSVKVIGKGDKERFVYFNDKTKVYIEKYLSSRNDKNTALFVTSRYPYNRLGKRGFQDIVSNIAKRAGFDKSVYPHLLRHTFATLGHKAGADLTTLQALLGHEDSSTTQIYAELDQENIRHKYNQNLIQ